MTTTNGQTYMSQPQQNPAMLFAGQPQQQQFQQQPQQQQFQQQPQIVDQQQAFQQQPQQQQFSQQPQIVDQQQAFQQQQEYSQQPPYNQGQVELNAQNLSLNELSDAGKEIFNMFANKQQQQPMYYMPMQQQMPPQEENQGGFFNGWVGKGVLVGTGAIAGYGMAKMMAGPGPSSQDINNIVQGAQTLARSNSSDIMKALKSFF